MKNRTYTFLFFLGCLALACSNKKKIQSFILPDYIFSISKALWLDDESSIIIFNNQTAGILNHEKASIQKKLEFSKSFFISAFEHLTAKNYFSDSIVLEEPYSENHHINYHIEGVYVNHNKHIITLVIRFNIFQLSIKKGMIQGVFQDYLDAQGVVVYCIVNTNYDLEFIGQPKVKLSKQLKVSAGIMPRFYPDFFVSDHEVVLPNILVNGDSNYVLSSFNSDDWSFNKYYNVKTRGVRLGEPFIPDCKIKQYDNQLYTCIDGTLYKCDSFQFNKMLDMNSLSSPPECFFVNKVDSEISFAYLMTDAGKNKLINAKYNFMGDLIEQNEYKLPLNSKPIVDYFDNNLLFIYKNEKQNYVANLLYND